MSILPRSPSQVLARGVGALSRRLGRGGGTSAPGRVLLRLRPEAIQELGGALPRGSLVLSATNGKTTTARLIGSCVSADGWPTVSNRAGANLVFGVATALLEGATVQEVLEQLFERFEELRPRIADDDGGLRRFVNVYVAGEDIRFLDGLSTPVSDGSELTILPAVAGGG